MSKTSFSIAIELRVIGPDASEGTRMMKVRTCKGALWVRVRSASAGADEHAAGLRAPQRLRMATARPPPWHRPLKHDAYGEINSSVLVFQNALSLHFKMLAGAVLLGDGTFLYRLLTRPRKVSKIFGVVFSITYHGSKSRVSFTCRMRRCRDSVDRLWNAPGMRWDQCLREAAFKHYLRRLEPHVLAMFNNKNEFNKQCRALGVPMPTPIDLLEGLPHGVDLFVKPNSGTFGRGVRAFSWRDGKLVNAVDHEEIIDEDVLVSELRGQDVGVEERLFNHQSIIELDPSVSASTNAPLPASCAPTEATHATDRSSRRGGRRDGIKLSLMIGEREQRPVSV